MKDSIEKLGSINADEQSVIIVTDGYSQVGFQITGTWAGTLEFEGTINGDTWFKLDAEPFPSGDKVNSTTANGAWKAQCATAILVRVRCSTYTSGSAKVFMRAVAAGGGGAAGGGSSTDGSTFTPGTTGGTPMQGVYESTPSTVADGKTGTVGIDTTRAQITNPKQFNKNIDSITNYPAGCEITTVDLATDADVVVTSSPAQLVGIFVSVVMSAHAALIKDSSTTKITLPASTAAGTRIDCYNANFLTNITVESDNAATGTLLVFWRAI